MIGHPPEDGTTGPLSNAGRESAETTAVSTLAKFRWTCSQASTLGPVGYYLRAVIGHQGTLTDLAASLRSRPVAIRSSIEIVPWADELFDGLGQSDAAAEIEGLHYGHSALGRCSKPPRHGSDWPTSKPSSSEAKASKEL